MTEEEKKEDNSNILQKEIESWNNHFGYALREENRILFNKMLSECLTDEQYRNAVNSKGENYTAESLFMALIFQQQKMISTLIDQLSSEDTKKNSKKEKK
jgi:hypothetical protein